MILFAWDWLSFGVQARPKVIEVGRKGEICKILPVKCLTALVCRQLVGNNSRRTRTVTFFSVLTPLVPQYNHESIVANYYLVPIH